jgi:hypothetical protein
MSPLSPPREFWTARAASVARGTLRDGLGALGNLAILASSVKVGSRAIARVLPDVLSSCEPMRAAVNELARGVSGNLEAEQAASGLQAFFDEHLRELARELDGLVDEPFRASERLDLDRLLARLSGRLDAAQALLELLDTAANERVATIHLGELLRQHLAGAPSGRRPQRRFKVTLTTQGNVEADVKPRALSELVAAELELLPAASVPHLSLSLLPSGHAITISQTPSAQGEVLDVWGYGVIEPSLACVAAAAGLVGVTRVPTADGIRLDIPR